MTLDDAPAIGALLLASDTAVLGRSDYTLTELEADLRRSDLEHTGWYDESGTLVGYGWVGRAEQTSKVELDVYVHPEHDGALGGEILAVLEARGLELAAAAGHDDALFDTAAYRQDERTRGWLADRGFAMATTFTRMRIDLPGREPTPEPRTGVVVRRSDAEDDDLRLALDIHEKAFTEHYGHVPRSFEKFREQFHAHGPDWSSLWIGDVDGEPAGLLIGTQQFVEEENGGYVRIVGVLPEARGRGLAKALLQTYFAAAEEDGRTAVLLHVDQGNVTNALGLYESVGMRSVLQIDAWAKKVSTARR
jgi:ribosomal protein S18 acetylase RimI-like enzyme